MRPIELTREIQQLVVHQVNHYFNYDKDFYSRKELDLTGNSWSSLKYEKSKLENFNVNKACKIIETLFTPYEQILFKKMPKTKKQKSGCELYSDFSKVKTDIFKEWIENDRDKLTIVTDWFVNADGTPSKPYIKISLDLHYVMLSMRFRTKDGFIPKLTKQELLEWAIKNVKKLI